MHCHILPMHHFHTLCIVLLLYSVQRSRCVVAHIGTTVTPLAYHMYAADMTEHCGLNSWQHNSAIRHLTATSPEGPYIPQEVVMKPFAHNPTVHQAADGTFLIYHIGGGTTGNRPPITTCTNGTTPSAPTLSADDTIPFALPLGSDITPNVLFSKSATGPWTTLTFESSGAACNNPAAHTFENGTVLLVCKVMTGNPGIRTMQVASAPSWRGPYRVISTTDVYGEDAYIWQQPQDGSFHMLLHSMYPDKIPTTAWSPDGIAWTPAFVANRSTPLSATYPSFSHELNSTSTGLIRVARRERHQLLLNPSTTGPAGWLFNGVTVEDGGDFSFTSVQAIGASEL
eukprot:m.179579 g.179579  ORF g.179579 m.179579 type:complete len:341 (-) comp24544_c0_seq2:280-1302(-)